MSDLVNLNISEELIKNVIQEEVKAGIIRALGDPSQIVRTAIEKMTDLYVDNDGKFCKKGAWYAKPYFDWLAEQTVKECVRDEIIKYVSENKDGLENEIRTQLKSTKFRSNLAASFIQSIVDSSKCNWKMPINISFEQPKEDY